MNGRRPASSSNNRTPAAYTSVRASTGAAFTCSGDMYAGVPNTAPTRVTSRPWSASSTPRGTSPCRSPAAARDRPGPAAPGGTRWRVSDRGGRSPLPCAKASPRSVWRAMSSARHSGSGPSLISCRQRLALQELHHQIRHAAVDAGVRHRDDVGVGERRQRPRLPLETLAPLRDGGRVLVQHLDRHEPAELGLLRPVHDAHTALAEAARAPRSARPASVRGADRVRNRTRSAPKAVTISRNNSRQTPLPDPLPASRGEGTGSRPLEVAGQRWGCPVDVGARAGRARKIGGEGARRCGRVALQELVDHGVQRSGVLRPPAAVGA